MRRKKKVFEYARCKFADGYVNAWWMGRRASTRLDKAGVGERG